MRQRRSNLKRVKKSRPDLLLELGKQAHLPGTLLNGEKECSWTNSSGERNACCSTGKVEEVSVIEEKREGSLSEKDRPMTTLIMF